jgi:hypothetical protein
VNDNRSVGSLFSRGRPANVWYACALLTLVVAVAFPLFAWVGYNSYGWNGVAASGVAAGCCWLGALAALIFGALLSRSGNAANGVLLGMLFRMGIPLAFGIALDRRGGPLADAGVFGMILVYYFVTLVAETALSLKLLPPADKSTNVTKAP